MSAPDRYFYSFKYFNEGPFKDVPYAFGLVSEDGRVQYGALIAEQIERLPENMRKELDRLTPIVSINRIGRDVVNLMHEAPEIEIWSLGAKCRHFFVEMYGGMENGAYEQFRAKSIGRITPRDIRHIWDGLGQPELPSIQMGNRHDALLTAQWQKNLFQKLRAHAAQTPLQTTSLTHDQPETLLLAYDWEFYRTSRFEIIPISLGIISRDGAIKMHLKFPEFLNKLRGSTHQGAWIQANVLPLLNEAEAITIDQLKARFGEMFKSYQRIVAVADNDTSDRFLMLHAGIARALGQSQVLEFRDADNLLKAIGSPRLMPRDPQCRHNALADAQYTLAIVEECARLEQELGIALDPIRPPDFKFRPQPSPLWQRRDDEPFALLPQP